MSKISYIISCYNRPHMLMCCMSSINSQTHRDCEIIVVDNHPSASQRNLNYQAFNSVRMGQSSYMATIKPTCYHSSEIGVSIATGDWLCFPSDDSYYVPTFAEKMLERENEFDLVACDMVFSNPYRCVHVSPEVGHIDKTGFILRRSLFPGFPNKPETDQPCTADGQMVERIMLSGARYRKVPEILAVHN